MSIDFPLVRRVTSRGTLWVPYLDVSIRGRDRWLEFRFLLDTGADSSMFPGYAAKLLGIDPAACAKVDVRGIGGRTMRSRAAKVRARIGGREFAMGCLFSSSDRTPFLLGRTDVFTRFSFTVDNRAHVLRMIPLRG